jgi:hypothetical protein
MVQSIYYSRHKHTADAISLAEVVFSSYPIMASDAISGKTLASTPALLILIWNTF